MECDTLVCGSNKEFISFQGCPCDTVYWLPEDIAREAKIARFQSFEWYVPTVAPIFVILNSWMINSPYISRLKLRKKVQLLTASGMVMRLKSPSLVTPWQSRKIFSGLTSRWQYCLMWIWCKAYWSKRRYMNHNKDNASTGNRINSIFLLTESKSVKIFQSVNSGKG